jgi:hypothetical protein
VKQYVVGGARGGGGSNFTGSYSSTGICKAGTVLRQLAPAKPSLRRLRNDEAP